MTDTNALIGTKLMTFPGNYFNYSYGSQTFDGSTEKAAVVFQALEDCDLTGMTAYCGSVSSPPTYKFTLQGVDPASTPGDPDGSVVATTAEFTPTASTIEAHSFTSALTVSQGDVLAGVLEYGSGTISGSNDALFRVTTGTPPYTSFPYYTFYNGSSWTAATRAYPSFAVQTDEGYDIGGIFNIGKGSNLLSSTGHRNCQRLLIPADEDIEIHIEGFEYEGAVENLGGAEFKAGIWNAAGAEIASVAIDSNQQAAQQAAYFTRSYIFDDSATLEAGTVYYLGFEHTGDNITITYAQPLGANGLRSWPGGAAFYFATWNGSSWTDDNTKRLCLNPIISSLHGTGGGGGGGSTTGATMGVIG